MQCQSCKENTATIHLTEISNGQRMETHLCEPCAQKQGLAVKSQIPLNELLSTLLAVQSEAQGEPADSTGMDMDLACPNCGTTLEKFRKTSLLGCPEDYEVFSKPLGLIIERSHQGHTEHRGKVPSQAPEQTRQTSELMDLRRKLDAAVKAEDYETAAKLRDEMKNLE